MDRVAAGESIPELVGKPIITYAQAVGREVEVKQYGEQWRGTFNGTTYRMFTVAPSGFMPELLRLQRMYSHPPEDESWEDLWVVA